MSAGVGRLICAASIVATVLSSDATPRGCTGQVRTCTFNQSNNDCQNYCTMSLTGLTLLTVCARGVLAPHPVARSFSRSFPNSTSTVSMPLATLSASSLPTAGGQTNRPGSTQPHKAGPAPSPASGRVVALPALSLRHPPRHLQLQHTASGRGQPPLVKSPVKATCL